MAKILKSINGSTLVQVKDILWVFWDHELPPLSELTESSKASDFDCAAQIKILPNNKIQILELHELYQFNCCHSLLTTIELLAYGLKENGQFISFDAYLASPENYFPKNSFSQVSFSFKKDIYDVFYSFTYKNKPLKGQGQFIKYTYFEGMESVPESLEEVFELYVNLNNLIAQACTLGKDDMFLPCDQWARKQKETV